MKIAIIAAVALLAAGCTTTPTYQFQVSQDANKMPEAVRQKCEPIPKELGHGATMGNQTMAYNNLIGLYGECAKRDAAKADWIASQGQ